MLAIRRSPWGSLLAITVLAVLTGSALAGAALADDGEPISLKAFDEALARAEAENKPVVLDFFTDW